MELDSIKQYLETYKDQIEGHDAMIVLSCVEMVVDYLLANQAPQAAQEDLAHE